MIVNLNCVEIPQIVTQLALVRIAFLHPNAQQIINQSIKRTLKLF